MTGILARMPRGSKDNDRTISATPGFNKSAPLPTMREMFPGSEAERLRAVIALASEIVTTRLELEAIMDLVARRATALTGASTGSIELVERGVPSGRAAIGGGVLAPSLSELGTLSALSVQLGETLRCDEAESDGRLNADACRETGVRSLLCVPLSHQDRIVAVLQVHSDKPSAFDDDDMETLDLLSGLIGAHLSNAAELDAARRDGYLDELTGLAARTAFDEALRGEVARASRYGLRLSLALLDVNRLARINDLHGRGYGDSVLLRVADVLRGVRASDLGFRVGEDEFALLLPNTPGSAALTVAERAAGEVGPCGLQPGEVTVSVGVAELQSADPPGLVAAAEAQLQAAKERRRGPRRR
jgi:diguanylate cyclase (GGDEF)-like protein